MNEKLGLTLPEILAQVVTFSLEDYSACKGGAPEAVRWTVAFTCACLLAQHTARGADGVASWRAMDALMIDKDMPYAQRLTLARDAVIAFGGLAAEADHDDARAPSARSGIPRYLVKGHETPHPESLLHVGGQHPPFRVFDFDEQVCLPGTFNNRRLFMQAAFPWCICGGRHAHSPQHGGHAGARVQ